MSPHRERELARELAERKLLDKIDAMNKTTKRLEQDKYNRMQGSFPIQNVGELGKIKDKIKLEKQDKEDKEIPVFSKKVLGYRNFLLNEYGELCSCGVGSHIKWMPGENRARCINKNPFQKADHIAPNKDCQCGLYCVHNCDQLWSAYSGNQNSICAAITGWGKIEVHEGGFRSEYAEIVLLAIDSTRGPIIAEQINKSSSLYNVGVVDITELIDKSKEFGDSLPDNVVPKGTTELDMNQWVTMKNVINWNTNILPPQIMVSNEYPTNNEIKYGYGVINE